MKRDLLTYDLSFPFVWFTYWAINYWQTHIQTSSSLCDAHRIHILFAPLCTRCSQVSPFRMMPDAFSHRHSIQEERETPFGSVWFRNGWQKGDSFVNPTIMCRPVCQQARAGPNKSSHPDLEFNHFFPRVLSEIIGLVTVLLHGPKSDHN
jgi:hypothetical protein